MTIKTLLVAALALPVLVSCLSDDEGTYNAGFTFLKPQTVYTYVFANNVADSIVMGSYGDWSMTETRNDGKWVNIATTEGRGGYIYRIPVSFEQNATGRSRVASFRVSDTNHSGKASAEWGYLQFATRGDGSLGNAPAVKSIVGTDGSQIVLGYDAQYRPVSLTMSKDGRSLARLSLQYRADSTLVVADGLTSFSGKYDNSYQASRLYAAGDTVGYYSQMNDYGLAVSPSYAFNVERHRTGGETLVYAYLLNGQSLSPDSVHNADSLGYYHKQGDDVALHRMKLNYGSLGSNLQQTVDVNHLLFGVELCDPYQLLSLFRYARNTNVVENMTEDGRVKASVSSLSRNADGSVSSMTVTTLTGETVTYTFNY